MVVSLILSKVFWFRLIHWNRAFLNSSTVTKGFLKIVLFNNFSFKVFIHLFTHEVILYIFNRSTCCTFCERLADLFNSSNSGSKLLKMSRSLNFFSLRKFGSWFSSIWESTQVLIKTLESDVLTESISLLNNKFPKSSSMGIVEPLIRASKTYLNYTWFKNWF